MRRIIKKLFMCSGAVLVGILLLGALFPAIAFARTVSAGNSNVGPSITTIHAVTSGKTSVVHPAIYPTACNNVTLSILDSNDNWHCYYGTGTINVGGFEMIYLTSNGWSGHLYVANYGAHNPILFCNTTNGAEPNVELETVVVSTTKLC